MAEPVLCHEQYRGSLRCLGVFQFGCELSQGGDKVICVSWVPGRVCSRLAAGAAALAWAVPGALFVSLQPTSWLCTTA